LWCFLLQFRITLHTFTDFKCNSYHICINIRQPPSQSSVSRKIPIFTLVRSLYYLVFAFFNIQKLNNNQHHNTDSINYNRHYKRIMNWISHCQHFISRRRVSSYLPQDIHTVWHAALFKPLLRWNLVHYLFQTVLTHWPISSTDDLVSC